MKRDLFVFAGGVFEADHLFELVQDLTPDGGEELLGMSQSYFHRPAVRLAFKLLQDFPEPVAWAGIKLRPRLFDGG